MALLFEIYRDGQRVTSFAPVGAIAMGPESVPISGQVDFRDGLLIASRTDEGAIGVALMWDMGPVGSYYMETTRLPQRDSRETVDHLMRESIEKYFRIRVAAEVRDMDVYVLTAPNGTVSATRTPLDEPGSFGWVDIQTPASAPDNVVELNRRRRPISNCCSMPSA